MNSNMVVPCQILYIFLWIGNARLAITAGHF